jgi:two-component system sensor histidine kinase BarA
MTKLGLRDSVLTLTLIPTVIIGLLLGGYFTINRYIELDEILYQQGTTISEPLAIALEQPLLEKNKQLLNRVISYTHNKHSPVVKAIALFDDNNKLIITSNYHRSFDDLLNNEQLNNLNATQVHKTDDLITFFTPIINHTSPDTKWDKSIFQTSLGTVVLQLNRDQAVIGQQRALLVSGIVIILALVLAAILALKLSHMFMTPLNKLVLATDRLVEGKRETGLNESMIGEFELLREGLNTISYSMVMQKDEMQKNIDQATSDYRETLEQYETQNIQLTMAKKEAQDANRVKSDFLAKMSHELRTPLNGVIGFTRQLHKTPLNKNQKDYLDTIELSANSLMTIISDILDFSKLEAGAMELESIQFQLRDTVNEVMTLLAPSAHDKQLELSIYISPQVPDHLTGDPTRLKQVLINLLSNAIKFTEKGAIKVDISHRLLDDERTSILVSVADTGVGIPVDKQDALFTAFGQADSSITRKFGGTGLGLIITKHIVEAMSGKITLNSAPGNGTCFTFNGVFRLPNHVFASDLPTKSLLGKHVLYLEPHEHTHHAVLSLLNEWQISVTGCFSDAEFLAAIDNKEQQYDICIIGDMASVNDMQRLKAHVKAVRESTDYLYLMLNTVSHSMREAFIGSGADACLSKPLNHRKLCELLAAPYRLDHPVHNIEQNEQTLLPLKVLVVDDNDANLKLIYTLLNEQVELIDTAHNGSQAYSLSKSHKYDVIFMDIQMPIMDGITACKLIKESSLNEDTPIIAVTAHALHSEKEQLLKDGFEGYLTKPIDEDMLNQIICDHSPQLPVSRDKLKNMPQSPPPFKSVRLDWGIALQHAGGKSELALEMLNMLLLSVPETLSLLAQAIADEDCKQVLSIIHKLHGACCYTGVPKLKSLAETIETALKSNCVLATIEPELFELQDELENLLLDAKN